MSSFLYTELLPLSEIVMTSGMLSLSIIPERRTASLSTVMTILSVGMKRCSGSEARTKFFIM